MSEKEKLSKIEEIMDVEEGTLVPENRLDSYDEWDSITMLSIVALMSDEFNKTITGEEIKKLQTVQDLLDIMK